MLAFIHRIHLYGQHQRQLQLNQLSQKRLRQYVSVHVVRLWECLLIRHLTRHSLSLVKLLLAHTVWNIQHLIMSIIMF